MRERSKDEFLSRRGLFVFALVFSFGAAIYLVGVPHNPPGFFIDESSIAYNAYTISQTGNDEFVTQWQLFFRAFGEYKNPTFIYLLAAIFRVTGPSITAARLLSATLGLVSSFLFGILVWRITGRLIVVLIVAISTLLAPWLYESSRLVFEVAIYPSLIALFLLALWRASTGAKWKVPDILAVAATLALLTYSYSIGRLLAPLLAAGLAFFITRRSWRAVFKTWVVFALTLIPLFVFYRRHPGALTDRFRLLTYINPQSSFGDNARDFIWHYLDNISPWRWLFTGEANVRDHVSGTGALLAATVCLGLVGLVLIWRNHRREAWWQFILYALVVSVVPASLTRNDFPQLRLIAFPVFFSVLMLPAILWLLNEVPKRNVKRAILAAAVLLIMAQGAYFQWIFHKTAPNLWYVFDARFPRKVLAVALATSNRPIYLVDGPGKSGYIQTFWYGALRGVDRALLVRQPAGELPPPGAVVISTEENCDNCKLLARSINYTVYAVAPSELHVTVAELPANAFRAKVTIENAPVALEPGIKTALTIIVENISDTSWQAVGESDGGYAVALRNRWLSTDGKLLSDQDGQIHFPYDLEPGDTAAMSLEITAPKTPGDYVLEVDVVQNRVSWFSDKGSQPLRLRLKVSHST